eukprot:2516213-Lingulodinium_polyedra.AAC.1
MHARLRVVRARGPAARVQPRVVERASRRQARACKARSVCTTRGPRVGRVWCEQARFARAFGTAPRSFGTAAR